MGLVGGLIAFGIAIMGFGFFWKLFDDIIDTYIVQYVLGGNYYILSDAIWNWLPWILVIFGIISLISGAIVYRGTVVQYE